MRVVTCLRIFARASTDLASVRGIRRRLLGAIGWRVDSQVENAGRSDFNLSVKAFLCYHDRRFESCGWLGFFRSCGRTVAVRRVCLASIRPKPTHRAQLATIRQT